MNNYQKALIEEHSDLIVKLKKFEAYVYSNESDNDNKVEFANKCIQLASMRKYEEALNARMENAGITFEDGNYFERVAQITPVIATVMPDAGSDYDVDRETQPNPENNEQ